MSMSGVRMTHIPYRGGGPAQQALIAGEVNVGFVDAVIAINSAEAGQLKMLGVSTTERLKLAPNVATIAETVPGFQSATDVAMFVRAGTPEPIIRRLSAALVAALKSPQVAEPLLKTGATLVGGSPQDFLRGRQPAGAGVGRDAHRREHERSHSDCCARVPERRDRGERPPNDGAWIRESRKGRRGEAIGQSEQR